MMRHVQRSGKLNKIVQKDNPLALFVSIIAVFYGDAIMANGYGGAISLTSPHCGRSRVSQVKLNR